MATVFDKPALDLKSKWERMGAWSPLTALKRARETKWLIDGVIPSGSIAWMVASPESFKSFLSIDMAASVAGGRAWHGRETDSAVVIYLASEGGNDVHIRRAAVDMAAGDTGPMCIVQMRPRLDESHGLASLLALVYCCTDEKVTFQDMMDYKNYHASKYLTPEERKTYDALDSCDMNALANIYGWKSNADVPEYLEDAGDYGRSISRSRYSAWDEAIASIYEDMDLYPINSAKESWRKSLSEILCAGHNIPPKEFLCLAIQRQPLRATKRPCRNSPSKCSKSSSLVR